MKNLDGEEWDGVNKIDTAIKHHRTHDAVWEKDQTDQKILEGSHETTMQKVWTEMWSSKAKTLKNVLKMCRETEYKRSMQCEEWVSGIVRKLREGKGSKNHEGKRRVVSKTLWEQRLWLEWALLWVIDEMATGLEVDRKQSFHASASVLCSSRDSHWQATQIFAF